MDLPCALSIVTENDPWGSVVGAVVMVLILNENVTAVDVGVLTSGLILYTERLRPKVVDLYSQYRLD